jgi:hypothetical protein
VFQWFEDLKKVESYCSKHYYICETEVDEQRICMHCKNAR